MTTITLQVPQDLAQRLEAERDRLPEILEAALEDRSTRAAAARPWPSSAEDVFGEMVEFLASRPTAQQVREFRVSAHSQARLADLLEKNRESELTSAESAELDAFEIVHDIMLRLKAQAL